MTSAGKKPTKREADLIRALVTGLDHDSVRALYEAVQVHAAIYGHLDRDTVYLDADSSIHDDLARLRRIGELLYRAASTRDYFTGTDER